MCLHAAMTRTRDDRTILGQLTDPLKPPHVAIKISRLRRPFAGLFKAMHLSRTRSLSSKLLITLIKTFLLHRWFQKSSVRLTFVKLHAHCIYCCRFSVPCAILHLV